jgi:hypothetical protein
VPEQEGEKGGDVGKEKKREKKKRGNRNRETHKVDFERRHSTRSCCGKPKPYPLNPKP